MLCVKDGEKQATPIGRGRGYRYGLPNQEYYFKSSEEMKSLFKDVPEAIVNIQEVVDKIEPLNWHVMFYYQSSIFLKNLSIQRMKLDGSNFGENAYLRHLTYIGAEKRYGELTDDIKERLILS